MEIVPETLVRRRLHPGNLTRQSGSGVQQALVQAVHESIIRRRQAAALAKRRERTDQT